MINSIGLSHGVVCWRWRTCSLERRCQATFTCTHRCARLISYLIFTHAARESPWSFPTKFFPSVRVHLICRHSIAPQLLLWWGGGEGGQESRWCEIDDLNTSSINAAADVVFGDWWRIQAIHLSHSQPSVKILRRFSVLVLHFHWGSAVDCWSVNVCWQI